MPENFERSLGRVEGKLDLIIKEMSDLSTAFRTLEAGRLSNLETKVANLTVRIAIISAGIPIAISMIFYFIQRYLLK